MIQRLVTSNPSPRYVRAVVAAFQAGEHGGTVYSGRYGCKLCNAFFILTWVLPLSLYDPACIVDASPILSDDVHHIVLV